MASSPAPLLEVDGLRVAFGSVQVVRGVTLTVRRGEAVGLVGESGSGKTVTALSLVRLVPDPPGKITGGAIRLDGEDVLSMPPAQLRRLRGGRVSMVFQDPFSCLDPTMTLGAQVVEAVLAHRGGTRAQAAERVLELFRAVRLPSPEMRLRQYPHQVSGGQRQRVMIAMAFATDPDLLIADEPTTALDVTVQAQIIALMDDFRRRTGAAVLLITHDLGVVAEMCDRVLVMYAGQIVEEAPVERVFSAPAHPYTAGLLASLPSLAADRRERLASIAGQPPDLAALPRGCPFAERCPRVVDACRQGEPPRVDVAPGQWARCLRAG